MTQEEKQLLYKDLCARLPYGVKVQCITQSSKNANASPLTEKLSPTIYEYAVNEDVEVKPYLRPMSSMTEEEQKEWIHLRTEVEKYTVGYDAVVDFYNSHHLDYRGLIYDGLALEAEEGMYDVS